MHPLHNTLADSFHEDSCLLLVLSQQLNTGKDGPSKLTLRPIEVQGERRYQMASRTGTAETHENLAPDEAIARVESLLGPRFAHCHLYTPQADISARLRPNGTYKIKRRPATKQEATIPAHNREKQRLIPEGVPCPFLVELGVMTSEGQVRASRNRKFRQINRFLELVDDTLDHLPQQEAWYVVDFGCGKSYLTFALHYLLGTIREHAIQIAGLDRNAEIVEQCNRLSERLGLSGLGFHVGEIADFTPAHHVNLAISLHACDTATDDAIAKAVAWQSDVILAVPCCQHELAAKLESQDLGALAEHGILKDRFAAIATDALRALALEICGYKTQVVEFIDMEHTAKNVLIRAIRRHDVHDSTGAIEDYRRLKHTLGLKRLHLEQALGTDFIEQVDPVGSAS